MSAAERAAILRPSRPNRSRSNIVPVPAWRAASTLLVLGAFLAAPAASQFARTEEVVEKESKEGEGRKLDASGLTTSFAFLVRATRSIAEADIGGGSVQVNAGKLPMKGADWDSFREFERGLLEFQTAAAIKLRAERPIVLGDLLVETGNVASGFAGLYSLWLHLDDAGQWSLIANHEADVWGTMRDPAHDLGSTPLEHSLAEEMTSLLTVEIDPPEGGEAGALRLAWGEHRWRVSLRPAG